MTGNAAPGREYAVYEAKKTTVNAGNFAAHSPQAIRSPAQAGLLTRYIVPAAFPAVASG